MNKHGMRYLVSLAAIALLAVSNATPGLGRVLEVGPHRAMKQPSMAADIAVAGDTVRIDPAIYVDCAVWRVSNLTIEATGPGVVLTGKSCLGKGIFVIIGDDTTIRGITFANARVPNHNGSGIREQGSGLTIEHCSFIDNEDGILAAGVAHSTIRITDSDFRGNGKCDGPCAHGIYIGRIESLQVERSKFSDTHIGHHVKSRALRTVLIGNTITDGETGTSSYLVDIPNGGDLLMQDNNLQKGPKTDNPTAAVSIGAEGVTNPTNELVVRDNTFTSTMSAYTIFVRNGTTAQAILSGNQLKGNVVPLSGPGVVKP